MEEKGKTHSSIFFANKLLAVQILQQKYVRMFICLNDNLPFDLLRII
jgi:hypothetical protein